ncbi:MAG: hypothetical protein CFH01_01241 [Alphaproteobacteria bacterium MarineAlpha2_Bin1]|nr:MAG: hypothetical protein CFH01_01241 [Alphaproteobacteria bacterium MarineAlpha2_Bin1]|tara:strand:- start:1463 stop:1888 length:426 start_codon:yes stop_codon:yes gene_type:complete
MKYSDYKITKILSNIKNIALIEASYNENKPSNNVMKYLLENGYNVIPVNSKETYGKIYEKEVFSSLEEIPCKIDLVNIFQKNDIVGQTMQKAIKLKIKYIWTQLNIFNFEIARRAENHNHIVIMNRCTKIEHKRLIKKKLI